MIHRPVTVVQFLLWQTVTRLPGIWVLTYHAWSGKPRELFQDFGNGRIDVGTDPSCPELARLPHISLHLAEGLCVVFQPFCHLHSSIAGDGAFCKTQRTTLLSIYTFYIRQCDPGDLSMCYTPFSFQVMYTCIHTDRFSSNNHWLFLHKHTHYCKITAELIIHFWFVTN